MKFIMIRCHLSRLMGERKLKIIDVARGSRVPRHMVAKLYYETAKRVDLDTINRLCRFFNCKVGDLFQYVPEDKESEQTKSDTG